MEFQLSPSPSCLLLLLLLVLQFLSRVHSQSIVRYLPGFDGPLPFHLETGYVSIGDADDAELFYYFFESENKPSEDPILFWFSGGPGCSGLNAIAFENGPLSFKIYKYNGSLPTLELNPYSWTKVSSIVFLDAPPGTGFSYSRSIKCYLSDKISSKQGFLFIKKWLTDHREFLSNPLYLSGDSYSGKTIPLIGQYISDGIEAGDELLINFKGYLLGNPVTDSYFDQKSKIPFAHGMALLSTELFESFKKNCGGEYYNVDPDNVQCTKDIQLVLECILGVNDPHILEPECLPSTSKLKKTYGYMLSYYWANDKEVQKVLNIRKGMVPEWIRCNQMGLNYSRNNDSKTWIKSLNYSIIDDWRPWFVGGQVAGYMRSYANNMTFATIKGAGHTAPEYKPYECFSMLKKWLSYEPL